MPRLVSTPGTSFWLALAVLLVAGLGRGAAQRHPTRFFDERNGLPSSSVCGIAQAKDGALWFATRSGIARFDGARWSIFGQAEGLPDGMQVELVAMEDGPLFARAANARPAFAEYDGERWRSLPDVPGVDARGQCVGMAGLGKGDSASLLAGWRHGSVCLWRGGRWLTLATTPRVRAVSAWGDRFLLATRRGLFEVDPHLEEPVPRRVAAVPPEPLVGLAPDGDRVWLFGQNFVWRYEAGRLERAIDTLPPEVVVRNNWFAACADRTGGVVFGDSMHVYWLDREGTITKLDDEAGLGDLGLTDVLCDREGTLWIASQRGVTHVLRRQFVSYTSDEVLPGGEVTAVADIGDGRLFLGHVDSVSVFDPERGTVIVDMLPRDPLAMSRVLMTAAIPSVPGIWAACGRGGLFHWREGKGVRRVPLPIREREAVMAFAPGPEQSLYVATRTALLQLSAGDVVRRVARFSGPLGGTRCLHLSDEGHVLVGTGNAGVVEFGADGRERRRWASDNAMGNNVIALADAAGGSMWAGTMGGLYRTDSDGALVAAENPSIERAVFFIVPAPNGITWFGTDNGVARWDGQRLRWFGMDDGLAGLETNRGAGRIAAGAFWVGTNRGLSVYRPDSLAPAIPPPSVTYLDVDVDGRPFRGR